MKRFTTRIFLTLAFVATLFVGCATLDPGADPVIVRAEQVQSATRSTIDLVLNEDDSNRGLYAATLPAFHEFCSWLRTPVPWSTTNLPRAIVMQLNLQNAKEAYRKNRNTNAFELILSLNETVLSQANSWSNVFTIK